jgi:hypothetical protein
MSRPMRGFQSHLHKEGLSPKEMGMKYGDYCAGIRAALETGCFTSRFACLVDAQAAPFFLLLGTLTGFDLLRDAEFPWG